MMLAQPNTALLVIDLQRGAFDGARCPPIADAQPLIERATSLVAAARAAGTPIVFIQHCDTAGEPFEEGSPHWLLHEALVPLHGDTVLHKHASSAFEGTDLGQRLDALEARELVLCGLQSEFCVANTARSALARGHAVTIAADAHGTWPSADESAAAISARMNRELAAAGARLATTAELAGSAANA